MVGFERLWSGVTTVVLSDRANKPRTFAAHWHQCSVAQSLGAQNLIDILFSQRPHAPHGVIQRPKTQGPSSVAALGAAVNSACSQCSIRKTCLVVRPCVAGHYAASVGCTQQ
jgi:hypothetical protein